MACGAAHLVRLDATTPTERIGLVAYLLAQGHTTTTRQLATDLGLTEHGARKMLEKLSRVLPLVNDGGIWRVFPGKRS